MGVESTAGDLGEVFVVPPSTNNTAILVVTPKDVSKQFLIRGVQIFSNGSRLEV